MFASRIKLAFGYRFLPSSANGGGFRHNIAIILSVSRTKSRRPLTLYHYEYFDTYSEALKREKFFKSGVGRRLLADTSDFPP